MLVDSANCVGNSGQFSHEMDLWLGRTKLQNQGVYCDTVLAKAI